MTPLTVMFRPGSTYAKLGTESVRGGAWVITWVTLRGPLFIALALACCISFLTRGYFAPGLIASGILAWSFVPLSEIAGLAVVWRAGQPRVSFAQAMDLFFAGRAPWLLWLVAFVLFWASREPQPPRVVVAWVVSMILIAAWSGYIDSQFFRLVAGMDTPVRYLLVQRAIAWTLFVLIFGGVSFWPGLIEQLRLR